MKNLFISIALVIISSVFAYCQKPIPTSIPTDIPRTPPDNTQKTPTELSEGQRKVLESPSDSSITLKNYSKILNNTAKRISDFQETAKSEHQESPDGERNETISDILKDERKSYRSSKMSLNVNYSKALILIRTNRPSQTSDLKDKLSEERKKYLDELDKLLIARNNGYEIIYTSFEFKPIRFFPSRNSKFSSLYFNELKEKSSINFLRNQFLSFGDDFGAISSEIVSAHAIGVRFSLSTAVAKVKIEDLDPDSLKSLTNEQLQDMVEEKSKENVANGTLANVVAGGGLLSFKAQYPVLNINGNIPHSFKMESELTGNISGTFAALGTSVPESEADLWGGLGSETKLFVPFIEFKDDNSLITSFGLFAEYDLRKIWGSGTFYSNLQINDSFWMNEFKIGLFANGIQITYTNLRFSNSTLDKKYENRLTVSFAPNKN